MSPSIGIVMSEQAKRYSWRQLASRAGVVDGDPQGNGFEGLGIPVYYARPDDIAVERPGLIVAPCSDTAWSSLLKQDPGSLDWLKLDCVLPTEGKLGFNGQIPVLFWGAGYEGGKKPFVEQREDGSIAFYADILSATLFMLSLWEEMVVSVRDEHNRFCAKTSVAYKQGFLDRPIVDEYALILRRWLQVSLPGWQPELPSFRVFLTHDMDRPVRGLSWKGALRIAIDDLEKHHSPTQAFRILSHYYEVKRDITNDDFYAAFRLLMDLSERHSFTSTFHFMASLGGPFDSGYDPRLSPYKDMIEEALTRGHQVGFHPGYSAFQNPQRFREERDRLAEVLVHTRFGGRQHYLRFDVPGTWRIWEEAGLLYDSTAGYADHEGFRCGTCHPFRPFDLEEDREMNLWERPLIAMDGTIKKYRSLAPTQVVERVLQLAGRCKQVGGEFVLLWHNVSSQTEWRPSAKMYQQLLSVLAHIEHGART